MNTRFIKINLPAYLISFVIAQMKGTGQPVKISKNCFIGDLIYNEIRKVPDDCVYNFRKRSGKQALTIDLYWIGGRSDKRINCNTGYYYVPDTAQRTLERKIEDFFNELFFNVIDISKEYTDGEYKDLIETFCVRYGIDFARNYEMLKKRHYRKRQELELAPSP